MDSELNESFIMEVKSNYLDCITCAPIKNISGNKRKFVKNSVRALLVDDLLTYEKMDKLLPKESERGAISSSI